MSGTRLVYHVPFLGSVATPLHEESDRIYRALLASGEIDRLKRLDHLGLMRYAWEGAHHSRWEYTVVILSLIERTKTVPEIHLASKSSLPGAQLSSGSELLKSWALLLNTGHLVWTFTAERAFMHEIWRTRQKGRTPYMAALPSPTAKAFGETLLKNGSPYAFFQSLAFARLPKVIGNRAGAGGQELCTKILDAYVSEPAGTQHRQLKRIFQNLRRLAYMALDTRYTPSVVTVDLAEGLADGQTLARLALRNGLRDRDELDDLGQYMARETYLGSAVLTEIAARESSLREVIRNSLRTRPFGSTLEALASGDLQNEVDAAPTKTVVRLSSDMLGGLRGYWPARINARVTQERLDSELKHEPQASALYWETPDRSDWVMQAFAHDESASSLVGAFHSIWSRATTAHANARSTITPTWVADTYSHRVGVALILQALPLFFAPDLRWEWGAAGAYGEALLVPRRRARGILQTECSVTDLPAFRRDELSMLARTLRRSPDAYAAVALAPLVAYREALSVAELDGLFVECSESAIGLTLVEAKRKNSGSQTAAERSLRRAISRLRVSPQAIASGVQSEPAGGGLSRAWIQLGIGA